MSETKFTPHKLQWAWVPHREGCHAAFGPYDSREDAIDGALEQLGPGEAILLGHPCMPDPAEWAGILVDAVLDQIACIADDEYSNCDGDPVIECDDSPTAKAVLEAALSGWLSEYAWVNVDWWCEYDEPATTPREIADE